MGWGGVGWGGVGWCSVVWCSVVWCRSMEDKSIKRFDNTTAALTSIADKGSRSVAEMFDLPLIVCIVVWCGVV